MNGWKDFIDTDLAYSILLTVALLIGVSLTRTFIARRIRGDNDILSDKQRQSLAKLSNYSITIIIVVFIVIWAVQLKNFALSLAAFAVAIVIAFKELILCISGSTVVASGTRSFEIGDWIEVAGYRGEVIGHNLLTTTLQEVSHAGNRSFTGKTLVIPNSIFLVQSLVNLNFAKKYVFQSYQLLLPGDSDWRTMKNKVEKEVTGIVQAFIETAKKYNALIEKNSGMDMPDADPVIRLRSDDEGRIFIVVKMFCPREKIELIETKLLEAVLTK